MLNKIRGAFQRKKLLPPPIRDLEKLEKQNKEHNEISQGGIYTVSTAVIIARYYYPDGQTKKDLKQQSNKAATNSNPDRLLQIASLSDGDGVVRSDHIIGGEFAEFGSTNQEKSVRHELIHGLVNQLIGDKLMFGREKIETSLSSIQEIGVSVMEYLLGDAWGNVSSDREKENTPILYYHALLYQNFKNQITPNQLKLIKEFLESNIPYIARILNARKFSDKRDPSAESYNLYRDPKEEYNMNKDLDRQIVIKYPDFALQSIEIDPDIIFDPDMLAFLNVTIAKIVKRGHKVSDDWLKEVTKMAKEEEK